MSTYRPTATIYVDIFNDEEEGATPQRLAEVAWGTVQDWVANNYKPVITVLTEDGGEYVVDLERQP